MHSKNGSIEIMVNDETDEVIKELFDLLKVNIKLILNQLKVVSLFSIMFYLLYFKYHKINPNRGGSYIDSPDWIKDKKSAINPISKKDNKCF